MIISLPYGDVLTRYAPDDTGVYNLFVSFSDLIKLITPNTNPTATRYTIVRRMNYTLKLKCIEGKKFVHINQVMDYMDNIHKETRINTMYIMQSLQQELKDFFKE